MNSLLKALTFLFYSIVSSLLSWNVAHASSIGVEPLFIEVSPGQSSALKIKNSSDETTTVEIFATRRVIDEKGIQVREDADDDFIIFPPQAAIRPSSTQVIRFQPISDQANASESYFITVRQVPVDLQEDPDSTSLRVKVIFAFDAAVHVVPRGSSPKPKVISADVGRMMAPKDTKTTNKSPEAIGDLFVKSADILLANDGDKYLYVQDYEFDLTATASDGSVLDIPALNRDEIINAVPVVLVPPGSKRIVKLPLPADIQAENITVKMKKRND